MTRYYICRCESPGHDIAVYILFGIKGLLQIIALIFAFSIRKVNVKGLDDSRFVIASVYVGSVCLLIAAVTFGLKNYEISIIVKFTAYFIGVTSVLLLMFMPKVNQMSSQ